MFPAPIRLMFECEGILSMCPHHSGRSVRKHGLPALPYHQLPFWPQCPRLYLMAGAPGGIRTQQSLCSRWFPFPISQAPGLL